MNLKNYYTIVLFSLFLFSTTQVKSQICGCNFDTCTQEVDCCRGIDCVFDNSNNGYCIGECINDDGFDTHVETHTITSSTAPNPSTTTTVGPLTEDFNTLSGLLIATLVFVIITCCIVCIFTGILCRDSRKDKSTF